MMNKMIAGYIAQTVEKIDPGIYVVATPYDVLVAPALDVSRGLFIKEHIFLEHRIPGGLLGYGEQSHVLAIRWDGDPNE